MNNYELSLSTTTSVSRSKGHSDRGEVKSHKRSHEDMRKTYPRRRHNMTSSSSSQIVDDDYNSVQDTTAASVSEGDLSQSDELDTSGDSQEQRVWNLELRRADMKHFNESESKLFRKLLRKLVKNNGGAITTGTANNSNQTSGKVNERKSNDESSKAKRDGSSTKRIKRKRKIITRRDKNGVIIEKVYKPYEGEDSSKEDVIVKYENGQPVASYTTSQLKALGSNQPNATSQVTRVLAPKPEQGTQLSVSSASKELQSSVAPVPETISKEPVKTTERSDNSLQSDFLPVQDKGKLSDSSTTDKLAYELLPAGDKLPSGDSEIVKNQDNKCFSDLIPQPEVADTSIQTKKEVKKRSKLIPTCRTKLTTGKKEGGPLVEFDYFHSAAGSSSSNKLLRYLVEARKSRCIEGNDDYSDPYNCLQIIESVLNRKPYKDELSSNSPSDAEDDNEQNAQVNPESAVESNRDSNTRADLKTDDKERNKDSMKNANGLVSKSRDKKKKGKKTNRKRKSEVLALSDDEKQTKSIVDKIVKKFKSDKDEDKSPANLRAALKLSHDVSTQLTDEQEKSFGFEILNPALGSERGSQLLQFEQNCTITNLELTDEMISRVPSAGVCLMCKTASNKSKGCLYGPYQVKQDTEQATGSLLAVWFHQECLLWDPNVCLVGSQLKGLNQLLETVLDPEFDYDATTTVKQTPADQPCGDTTQTDAAEKNQTELLPNASNYQLEIAT